MPTPKTSTIRELWGGRCVLHLADNRTLDVEADAIVSDPPYGMDNDTDSKRFSSGSVKRGVGRSDWEDIEGDREPFDPSPWMRYKKVVLWGANHFGQRLPVGTTLIWIKKADHLFGEFLSDAEVGWQKGGHGVYCFRKQFPPPSRIKEGAGKCCHPNQKPVTLMEWVLKRLNLPDDATVYDPYLGSGTTGVACMNLGYKFVGCEVVPQYFDEAFHRLRFPGLRRK